MRLKIEGCDVLVQTLMIVGRDDNARQLQFYDFIKKQWISLQPFPAVKGYMRLQTTILNEKLYYIKEDSEGNHLEMFDPITKQIAILNSSSTILPKCAMCTCGRFLYLCGGFINDESVSDQVLRYDPQTNTFETLTPMTIKRCGAAAIFYQNCVHVLGGSDGSSKLTSVEKYDPNKKSWAMFPPMCKPRYRYVAVVLDEKLYACGGRKNNRVEVYDPATNSWELVATMSKHRDRFLTIVHAGKLFAIGGDLERTVEVYDPSEGQWQIENEMTLELRIKHCKGGLISASCITSGE